MRGEVVNLRVRAVVLHSGPREQINTPEGERQRERERERERCTKIDSDRKTGREAVGAHGVQSMVAVRKEPCAQYPNDCSFQEQDCSISFQ